MIISAYWGWGHFIRRIPSVALVSALFYSSMILFRPFISTFSRQGVCDIDGGKEASGKGLVLVDIPGLLEGAHDGVGMGLAFLRHVQRCRYSMEVCRCL
jgi:GTP-binding protein